MIYASPFKGDLVQTVGRILRSKNAHHPLIIHIVDNILPFSNQARGHLGYYLAQGYECAYYNIPDGYDISNNGIQKIIQSIVAPVMPKEKKYNDDKAEDVWSDDETK
jgi:hypothetical protein